MDIIRRFYSKKSEVDTPSGPASETGGVLPIDLEGRHRLVRQRLTNMNDEERAFRRKFLHDQHIHEDEPVVVPEIYQELYNPIRRAYRAPMDAVQTFLTPKLVSIYLGLLITHNWRCKNIMFICTSADILIFFFTKFYKMYLLII